MENDGLYYIVCGSQCQLTLLAFSLIKVNIVASHL